MWPAEYLHITFNGITWQQFPHACAKLSPSDYQLFNMKYSSMTRLFRKRTDKTKYGN
jgi:hypothetical protein